MLLSPLSTLVTALLLVGTAVGKNDKASLVGTWSTKSNAVFTGPDFYDPVDELLIEPALPGISFSFTDDGYYEEAIYQVEADPQDPSCPTAVMIFQHGKYSILSNNSIQLKPFEVDGRQLLSDPCNDGGKSVYSRYKMPELFKEFDVYVDEYHGRYRLDLAKFDGQKFPPFYLAYKPPMMLPTQTMNPTKKGSGDSDDDDSSTPKQTESVSKRVKRSLENRSKTSAVKRQNWDYDLIWWTGVSLIFIGAAGWYAL